MVLPNAKNGATEGKNGATPSKKQYNLGFKDKIKKFKTWKMVLPTQKNGATKAKNGAIKSKNGATRSTIFLGELKNGATMFLGI